MKIKTDTLSPVIVVGSFLGTLNSLCQRNTLLPAENYKSDTDLETWYNQHPEYNLYVDEGISLKLKDFRTFIENRKQNLKKRLKEILQN